MWLMYPHYIIFLYLCYFKAKIKTHKKWERKLILIKQYKISANFQRRPKRPACVLLKNYSFFSFFSLSIIHLLAAWNRSLPWKCAHILHHLIKIIFFFFKENVCFGLVSKSWQSKFCLFVLFFQGKVLTKSNILNVLRNCLERFQLQEAMAFLTTSKYECLFWSYSWNVVVKFVYFYFINFFHSRQISDKKQ